MSTFDKWNYQNDLDALPPILACCGSQAFARGMVEARPFADIPTLFTAADAIWWSLSESDWREAFACHPRIGESVNHASQQFAAWSEEEQARARDAEDAVLHSIAEKNREYEVRHGFLYIVCASGKSAEELLTILDRRVRNTTEVEILEAAEQQRQITRIRLGKWLAQ